MTEPLTLTSLPIFPLHTVLFPGGYLPLRVFEPRYRMMVECCREEGAPFGVVTLLSGHEVRDLDSDLPPESFHTLGTMASIDTVEPMRSGLELIHCSGKDRFRIQRSRQLSSGLWVADVMLIAADSHTRVPPDLAHSVTALQHVLNKLPVRSLEGVGPPQFDDCGWVANRWCELFPLDIPQQLQLLSVESPLLRLELVTDALEHAGIVPHPKINT